MTEQTNIFAELVQINVNGNTEKKGNLTYLSWAWAWGIVKLRYPTANYKVIEFDGKPYLEDENLGYMVQTEVTINGETIPMHLPVMDFRNNAMKSRPYEYQVWDKRNNQYKTMKVEQASMMDINKAIMRCLAKNLAMFGLGHYIYAGEDLPPNIAPPQAPQQVQQPQQPQPINDERFQNAIIAIQSGKCTKQYLRTNFALTKEQEEKLLHT